ncbi:MAG: phosphoribosyltransferase family protein, partial [Merdibacter sp.]|nr:phosphoribosyltransferase family protein [Merdibacter sp.]
MEKKLIMDDLAIQRSLKRITHEIIEHNKGVDNIILVGIRSRGVYLARRLAALIRSFEQVEIPVYALDVSFWRDDHKRTQSRSEAIPVQERKVILVDDVLFKG